MNSHEEPRLKTIGLIGGMSWQSSAEYYRIINQETKRRLGGHHNAKSIMVTVDFDEIEELQRAGDWNRLGEVMAAAAKQLHRAGADFILVCANTMHKLAPAIESAVPIPLLHIGDATGTKIREAGLKTVGLLGTRFVMQEDFYRDRLKRKFGIEVLVPDADDRAEVNRVIYDELCHGKILEKSQLSYQDIITRLKDRGAEGVVLGCTEIPLLMKDTKAALPMFDTTQIHAEAAVDLAMQGLRAETMASS